MIIVLAIMSGVILILVAGCVVEPICCNDQTVCTRDTCDDVNGCQHTSKRSTP